MRAVLRRGIFAARARCVDERRVPAKACCTCGLDLSASSPPDVITVRAAPLRSSSVVRTSVAINALHSVLHFFAASRYPCARRALSRRKNSSDRHQHVPLVQNADHQNAGECAVVRSVRAQLGVCRKHCCAAACARCGDTRCVKPRRAQRRARALSCERGARTRFVLPSRRERRRASARRHPHRSRMIVLITAITFSDFADGPVITSVSESDISALRPCLLHHLPT